MAQDDRGLIAEWNNSFLPEAAVAKELSEVVRSIRPTWIFRQLLNGSRPSPSILRDIAAEMRAGFSVTRGRK